MMRLGIILVCLVSLQLTCGQAPDDEDKGLLLTVRPNNYYITGLLDMYKGQVDQMTDLDGFQRKRVLFQTRRDVSDLDSNPERHEVYLADTTNRNMYKLQNYSYSSTSNPTATLVHEGISQDPDVRIAYDWLAGNLYWTDPLLNFIGILQPDNPTIFKELVHDEVDFPAGIAVDPINMQLFWSEHRLYQTYIIKSDLAGENKTQIVTSGLWIPDVAVDIQAKRIYWLDNNRNGIESSDYQGNNKTLIYRSTNILIWMNNLMSFNDYVCTTQFLQRRVDCVTKSSRTIVLRSEYQYDEPYGIAVYDKTSQPSVSHPCQNNDCMHMCINTPGGKKCICADGFQLQIDGKSCIKIHAYFHQGIIYTDGTSLNIMDIRVITGKDHTENEMEMLSWSANILHITVDSLRHIVYFADSDNEIIKYEFSNNEQTTTVGTTGLVSGLVYSFMDDNIYWSEEDTGMIKMMSTTNYQQYILYSGLTSPKWLTLDAHNGTLFWISGSNGNFQIEEASTNGTYRITLFTSTTYLSDPLGLNYDDYFNWVFWINDEKIWSVPPAGGSGTDHGPSTASSNLITYKNYILTVVNQNAIHAIDYYGVTEPYDINVGLVTDFVIHDDSIQRPKGPCESKNGGCEQICITSGQSAVCRCGFGYTLSANQKDCYSTPLTTDFAMIVDMTHGVIYQIDMNNQSAVVAVDFPYYIAPIAAYCNSTHIYWSDLIDGLIFSSTLDGSSTEAIGYTPLHIVLQMAVDVSTGNLYFTAASVYDFVDSFVAVIHPGIQDMKTLVTGLKVAYGFALYSEIGEMYWTDKDTILGAGSVQKANMDGTKIRTMANYLTAPISLAVDTQGNRLFWCDRTDSAIYVIGINDYMNESPTKFYEKQGAMMAHLTIFQNEIYFTATNIHGVSKLKMNQTYVQWMPDMSEFGRVETVQIIPGDTLKGHPVCSQNNGKCSTFCLPVGTNGRTCGCPDGENLLPDGRTCEGVTKCPEFISHGTFDDDCTAYVGSQCSFDCNDGYELTADVPDLFSCGVNGTWDYSPIGLCAAKYTGTNVAAIVSPILVIVILACIGLVLFIVYYRRKQGPFAHARFENSPNININTANAERDFNELAYPTQQPMPTQTAVGAMAVGPPPEYGLSNPMYETKTPIPTSDNSNYETKPAIPTLDVSMNEHTYTSLDLTKKA